MIVSRTPLRISLLGGGSDFPDFFNQDIGKVISFGIDKYIYTCVKKRFECNYKISYSKTEEVDSLYDIKNDIVREACSMLEVPSGTEISLMADIPSFGTGLGSSSCLSVGLLNSLSRYMDKEYDQHSLADLACELELNRLGSPIGIQDQFACAFGKLRKYTFGPKTTLVETLINQQETISFIEDHMLLFYLGGQRNANEILTEQKSNIEEKRKVINKMVALIPKMEKALLFKDVRAVGDILKYSWELKKSLASKISNLNVETYVSFAYSLGALGVKLNGAGASGFLSVWTDKSNRENLINNFGLKHIPFKIDTEGTKVIGF